MLTMRTLGRGVSAPGLVSPRTQLRSGQIFPQLADDGRWMIYDGVWCWTFNGHFMELMDLMMKIDDGYSLDVWYSLDERMHFLSDTALWWQHGLARHRLSILQWSTSTLYVVSVPFRNEVLCWDSSSRRIPKLLSCDDQSCKAPCLGVRIWSRYEGSTWSNRMAQRCQPHHITPSWDQLSVVVSQQFLCNVCSFFTYSDDIQVV